MADEPAVNMSRGGVLTKYEIEGLCSGTAPMIFPFETKHLRDAAYTLHVGENYASGGQRRTLGHGDRIEIAPHDVAIIETEEALRLPAWLIGRWNLKVMLAYEGLLWVGGAQVDPAFVGKLVCPIYNLSTKTFTFKRGDPLATIDFVTTTSEMRNHKFWSPRGFEYYKPFESGVKQEIDGLAKFERRQAGLIDRLERSQGDFVTLVFTIVAILFAAVAVIATRTNLAGPFWAAPVVVSTVALFFALWAAYGGGRRIGPVGWRRWVILAIALSLVAFGLWRDWRANDEAAALSSRMNDIQARLGRLEARARSSQSTPRAGPEGRPRR